jgi:hypothetical protein
MTKKKPVTKKVESIVEESIEPEPAEELPVRQIEESPVEQTIESEPVAQVQDAEPEKSAEPQPVVEVVVEPAPVPVPPAKPKPLTMTSLHAEIEELRKIIDGQSALIKQLMETPVKQRRPPTSNGKVSIKDTLTSKIYPSKNNVFQTLLKAGELDDLVKQGVFGADPIHNSFGCYNLFRAYPGRFQEVKPSDVA